MRKFWKKTPSNKPIESDKKFVDVLRKQSDDKNFQDCEIILKDLNEASLQGEYVKTAKLKPNQAYFLKKLGLIINRIKIDTYEISWKNEE